MWHTTSRGLGLAAALTVWIASAPVLAQTPVSARLVYRRGAGADHCPGERAVRAAVSARLGYDPFFTSAADMLFARVRRRGGSFHAAVKLVGADQQTKGEREITVPGSDCAAIVDALGLTISLTLNPSALAGVPRPAEPRPAKGPEEEVDPSPRAAQASEATASVDPAPAMIVRHPATAPATTAAVATTPSRWSYHLGAGALGSVRAAPVATAGAALFAGASWRALSLDVELRADLPATGPGDAGDAQVRTRLLLGEIVPCAWLGPAFGCPVLAGGFITATARQVAEAHQRSGTFSAWGARLGAEWRVGTYLALRGYAELLIPTARDTFLVDTTRAYTVRSWSGVLAAAAVWRWQ